MYLPSYQPGAKQMFDITPYLTLIHISVVWNQFIWTRPAGDKLLVPNLSRAANGNNTKLGIARWSPPLAVRIFAWAC